MSALNLHEFFEKIVSEHPGNIALVLDEVKITYSELNKKANQLANHIRNIHRTNFHGEITANRNIGICVERGIQLVISILAVLKSGGSYVPLDPGYPESRLNFISKDSDIRILISHNQFENLFPDISKDRIINLDAENDQINNENFCNLENITLATDPAYIIYTSGSTGTPKGVTVPHSGVCNMILWTIHTYPITPSDRIIQIASFAFDLSVWEIFSALLSGATLVLVLPTMHRDTNYLLNVMIDNNVTVIGSVPTLFKAILHAPHVKKLQSLKHILSCAEPLTPEVCKGILSTFKANLYNGYGPTETTIMSTHWLCDRENIPDTIPIGKPVSNTQLYVLDENKNIIPRGAVGELYIGGLGVTNGYLNQPELTKDKFISLQFSNNERITVFKTGDLVRFLPDGNLDFIGRVDHQVKLRGFRIELGEVESVIKNFSVIENCVVSLKEINKSSFLVAYYTLNKYVKAEEFDHSSLRLHLNKILPNYMVPTYFIYMQSLPINANGKLDRNNLPTPNANDRFTKRRISNE
jgi:amino acid adenylation domain-containing protein